MCTAGRLSKLTLCTHHRKERTVSEMQCVSMVLSQSEAVQSIDEISSKTLLAKCGVRCAAELLSPGRMSIVCGVADYKNGWEYSGEFFCSIE